MINLAHYVVDIETLSTQPRAAVTSIGVVRIEHGRPVAELYLRLKLNQVLNLHSKIDASTITWWLQQSAEARAELDGSQSATPLGTALHELSAFMHGHSAADFRVWGKGPSFDNVILRELYRSARLPAPWGYQQDRCLRTMQELFREAFKAVPFEGIRHHALHDARHEAQQLAAALALLGSTGGRDA